MGNVSDEEMVTNVTMNVYDGEMADGERSYTYYPRKINRWT